MNPSRTFLLSGAALVALAAIAFASPTFAEPADDAPDSSAAAAAIDPTLAERPAPAPAPDQDPAPADQAPAPEPAPAGETEPSEEKPEPDVDPAPAPATDEAAVKLTGIQKLEQLGAHILEHLEELATDAETDVAAEIATAKTSIEAGVLKAIKAITG